MNNHGENWEIFRLQRVSCKTWEDAYDEWLQWYLATRLVLIELREACNAVDDVGALVHDYQRRCAESWVVLRQVIKVHQHRVTHTASHQSRWLFNGAALSK